MNVVFHHLCVKVPGLSVSTTQRHLKTLFQRSDQSMEVNSLTQSPGLGLLFLFSILRFLYRKTSQPSDCPGVLSGSHQISEYSEYDSASSQYIENCGEPRSEINSCHRRDQDDPQITINLGTVLSSLSCAGLYCSVLQVNAPVGLCTTGAP